MASEAAKTPASVFQFKTFLMLSGGSKGYGSCLAKRITRKLPSGSVALLLARDKVALESTKKSITEQCGVGITVKTYSVDLCDLSATDFDQLLRKTLEDLGVGPADFEQSIIVHNAASMGDISKIYSQHHDKQGLQRYWDLNLTSVTTLNWAFFKHFPEGSVKQRVVINISSICGLQPFKSWSLYCAGKAARDMLFRTMALEEPSVRVLNYAPGPLDTEMQIIARTETGDAELKQMFIDMKANDRLLQCDESVDKLEKLLQANTFDSGAHIDYYDL